MDPADLARWQSYLYRTLSLTVLPSSSVPSLTSTVWITTQPIISAPAPSRRMAPSPATGLSPRPTAPSPPTHPWLSQTAQQTWAEPCRPLHPAGRAHWLARRTSLWTTRRGRGRRGGSSQPGRGSSLRWTPGPWPTPPLRPGTPRTPTGWLWSPSRSWTTTPRRTRSGGGSAVWSSASVFYKYQNYPGWQTR